MTKQKLNNGNYAAIDIGSNAVRLLIKRISLDKEGLCSSKEQLIRVPLRLGADVFTGSKISKRKAKKLIRLIRSYADLMNIYEVLDYKACATSAIRDAENGREVMAQIKKQTGIKIHILSGKEEAKLIYNTHAEFLQDRTGNYMYVDVGGGSTEVNLMVNSSLVFSNSYDIGTIRVLSDTVDPEEWTRLENDLFALTKQYADIDLLGTGGNINKLYRLVEEKDKTLQRMTVEALRTINYRMVHLTLEERVNLFKLKYDRAEVIVPASHVFLTIADIVQAKYIYVPTVGLVDGIIDGLVFKKINHLKKLSKGSTDGMPEEEPETEREDLMEEANLMKEADQMDEADWKDEASAMTQECWRDDASAMEDISSKDDAAGTEDGAAETEAAPAPETEGASAPSSTPSSALSSAPFSSKIWK